jgi:hypothetical protein
LDQWPQGVKHGTNEVLLYLEGKVQLKHFYKKHIPWSRSNNGAAFVPNSETSLAKAGKITRFSLSV